MSKIAPWVFTKKRGCPRFFSCPTSVCSLQNANNSHYLGCLGASLSLCPCSGALVWLLVSLPDWLIILRRLIAAQLFPVVVII